jgi:hypothetical protein
MANEGSNSIWRLLSPDRLALLHPSRKPLTAAPPLPAETAEIAGESIVLKGWLFRAVGERCGAIVHLHGVADNRASVKGPLTRRAPLGGLSPAG